MTTTNMKTKAEVIRENSQYKSLINAVIKNIGIDNVENINSHGIAGGYSGFIYYSDTHKFAIKHQKDIVTMLEEMADSMGQDVVEMVSGFGVFRNSPMDQGDKKDLYKYLAGVKPSQGAITNVVAWFAAEEICRMFER